LQKVVESFRVQTHIYILASGVAHWSGQISCTSMNANVENLVITIPIKKRINTKLLIDRTAAPSRGKTQIRAMTKSYDKWIGICWLEERKYLQQKSYLGIMCENERSGVNPSWNEFNRNELKIEYCR